MEDKRELATDDDDDDDDKKKKKKESPCPFKRKMDEVEEIGGQVEEESIDQNGFKTKRTEKTKKVPHTMDNLFLAFWIFLSLSFRPVALVFVFLPPDKSALYTPLRRTPPERDFPQKEHIAPPKTITPTTQQSKPDPTSPKQCQSRPAQEPTTFNSTMIHLLFSAPSSVIRHP
jgi:hypothetical protein